METMSTKKALAERERLREEAKRARSSRIEHAERAKEADARLKKLPAEREAALRKQARTGEPTGVEKLDTERRTLESTIASERAARDAANAGWKAAEGELEALHFEQFAAFADNAEQLTEEAERRREALLAELRATHEAEQAARSEWGLIVASHNRVLAERLDSAQKAQGELKRRKLSPPPPSPLVAPGELEAAPPIRPPEIEPLEAEAA